MAVPHGTQGTFTWPLTLRRYFPSADRQERPSMRHLRIMPFGVVVICGALAAPWAFAAAPSSASSPAPRSIGVASAGALITQPLPAVKSPPASPLGGTNSRSWRTLDGAAYLQ